MSDGVSVTAVYGNDCIGKDYLLITSACNLSGLDVKHKRRRRGLATECQPLLRPAAPNITGSMDFVMNARAIRCRLQCLTCVDDFTKEYLTVIAAFGISGIQVTRILDSIALFRGYPATIRTDQGPEFICRALDQWTSGPLRMVLRLGIFNRVSRYTVDLSKDLMVDFGMSV